MLLWFIVQFPINQHKEHMMKIYFESSGGFITAAQNGGKVIIRCPFKYTDCGEDENLDHFIKRHDGELATAEYLQDSYTEATSIFNHRSI
jgi:hypothetical protein